MYIWVVHMYVYIHVCAGGPTLVSIKQQVNVSADLYYNHHMYTFVLWLCFDSLDI